LEGKSRNFRGGKMSKISRNQEKSGWIFDQKKINLPAIFWFLSLSKIWKIFGENFRKISKIFGNFWKLLKNFGNFSPRGHFPKSGKFRGKPLQKKQFYGCVFRFHPFLSGVSPGFPENPGKLILTNLDNFRKFFSTRGNFGKFRGNFPENVVSKSMIYRL
jgi:hypothetical protein